MNCNECMKKIKAFSDKKLSSKDTLDFIKHVSSCPTCYEEAKTQWLYYRVDAILQNQVENPDYHLKYAFEAELDKRQCGIYRTYLLHAIFILTLILAVLTTVFFIV